MSQFFGVCVLNTDKRHLDFASSSSPLLYILKFFSSAFSGRRNGFTQSLPEMSLPRCKRIAPSCQTAWRTRMPGFRLPYQSGRRMCLALLRKDQEKLAPFPQRGRYDHETFDGTWIWCHGANQRGNKARKIMSSFTSKQIVLKEGCETTHTHTYTEYIQQSKNLDNNRTCSSIFTNFPKCSALSKWVISLTCCA